MRWAMLKGCVQREVERERGIARSKSAAMGSGGSKRLCGGMHVEWWRKGPVEGQEETQQDLYPNSDEKI